MNRYVLNENIAHYQKLIAASELDLWRDEVRHKTLLRLLDEEKAKIEPQRKVGGRAVPGVSRYAQQRGAVRA